MAGSPCTPPPARKLKGHGVRRGVAQAPEGAPKPPAGSKTACTTARQGALRVLPKARPLGDMKLDSEFTELRGSLSAEVSGAPGLCRRAPPPGTRLPPALGSGPPSSCRRAHEELFKAASRCLRRPRGAAHPGRSLRLVLPPAISPCSRQAAISATCLQGRKKGREELLLLNTRFYSGGDDSSSLSPADQHSQLRGAGLPGEVSISCHRAPGPARGGVAPRPSRRGFGDWRFLACPRQPAGGLLCVWPAWTLAASRGAGAACSPPPPRRGTRAPGGGGAPASLTCMQAGRRRHAPTPGGTGRAPSKAALATRTRMRGVGEGDRCPGAAETKHLRLGDWNNRNVFWPSSAGWRSEVRVWAGVGWTGSPPQAPPSSRCCWASRRHIRPSPRPRSRGLVLCVSCSHQGTCRG